MITPTAVVTLNDVEKAIAAKMESVIDASITSESETNPESRKFTILRSNLGKAVVADGENVTLKISHHVLNSYRASGWLVEVDAESYVFTAPELKKRPGRKPGSKNKPKAVAIEIIETLPVAIQIETLPVVESLEPQLVSVA